MGGGPERPSDPPLGNISGVRASTSQATDELHAADNALCVRRTALKSADTITCHCVVHVLTYVLTLLAGAFAGAVMEFILSPVRRWWNRLSTARRLAHRRLDDYADRRFEFDGVDVGLQVLVGHLGGSFERRDVKATLSANRWTTPGLLRNEVLRFVEARQMEGTRFFDGQVARLERLEINPYADDDGTEHHRLSLYIDPTGFFDHLATNVALGPFKKHEAPILVSRSGLPLTTLSNMMALDLTLVTTDGWVPVFFRSAGMAGIENAWQASSGETVQLQVDRGTDQGPDVFETARRGLAEEMSIEPELISDIALTAIVATPEFANVGVLMRANIGCTGAELGQRLGRHVMAARDNWEHSRADIIPLDDVRELASALASRPEGWTKQAAASLIFAYAERTLGDIRPLARAIKATGGLKLHPGTPGGVLSPESLNNLRAVWAGWTAEDFRADP